MQNNNIIIRLFFILFFVSTASFLSGQEYLTGVDRNQTLKDWMKKSTGQKHFEANGAITLPFLDDFSELTITPDPNQWLDQDAYINDNYGKNQPTIGVATLDAINENGELYIFSDTASVMPGDTLTSRLIDATGLIPSDNVYLTFYVQGGGMGNTPQPQDSLILQARFKNDTLNGWLTVWSHEGEQMDFFEEVRIAFDDQSMLHDSTQFRFINFFSLEYAGMNCDHWNIDYVHMDANRSPNDSLIDEVAYTENINNILGTFSAVPWDHFKLYFAQIIDNVKYRFTNYSEQVMNLTPYLRWTNLYTGETGDLGNIANNYDPNTHYELEKPISGSLFTLNEDDSARFEIENRFFISESDYEPNNSTSRVVDLYNYYAYDDASAEGMYGVSNKFGMIAVKFNTYKADSLKAIRIYFNKSLNDENRYFNLMVWDEGGSGPGEVLYSKTRNLPAYADSINGFVTYELDSAIMVGETFYIGWQKITDQRLNMGFDKNFIAYQKNYFNANGSWELSQYNGSLMIRPVLREMFAFKDSFAPDEEPEEPESQFTVYPNPVPASGTLNIRPDVENWEIELFDQLGRLVFRGENETELNLSGLQRGLYLLRLSDGREYKTFKVIKQ